jgi:hypothetical protein
MGNIKQIWKGLKLIPSIFKKTEVVNNRDMEIRKLFRACCYMIVEENTCSKSQIQRRFNVNYDDATFVFNLLLENNLIRPIYKSNITDVAKMEKILDKIYR